MIKLMVLCKRRDGLSVDEFRDYYEANHAPLAAGHLPMLATYVRHYVSPMGSHANAEPEELPYDVVTELTFASEADFDACMAKLGEPEVSAEIVADEEKLFDRSSITFMRVDSVATDMA